MTSTQNGDKKKAELPNFGNLQSMLKWSAENCDPNLLKNTKQVNEETKKWLNDAINHYYVNPVDRMKENIQSLKDMSNETVLSGQHDAALQEIIHHTEKIDFANDFYKIGGLKFLISELIPHYLSMKSNNSKNEDFTNHLLALSLELISTCAQNNSYIQDVILSELPLAMIHLVRILQFNITKDSLPSSNKLRSKAITSLSSILTNNSKSLKFLLKNVSVLNFLLQLLKTQELQQVQPNDHNVPIDSNTRNKILYFLLNMISVDVDEATGLLVANDITSILSNYCLNHKVFAPSADISSVEITTEDLDVIETSLLIITFLLSSHKHHSIVMHAMEKSGIGSKLQHLSRYVKLQKRSSDDDEFANIREYLDKIPQQ